MKNKVPPISLFKTGKIIHLTENGLGRLFDDEGKQIDLPFCLPGETIQYEEVQRRRKKDYYFKNIEAISSERNDPLCPHFTKCGGCLLQHMKLGAYKEYKKSVILSLFTENGLDPFVVEDPVFLDLKDRRRANMDIVKKNGKVILGFHGFKSHGITNVEHCIVLDHEIESLLSPLKTALNDILNDFDKAKIFVLKADNGIDLSLEIQEVSALTPNQRNILLNFSKDVNLTRFTFRYRKTKDVIFEKEEPFVVIDDVRVTVNPWCFLQTSKKSDAILTKWVIDALPKKINKSVDLFCGRGTFTFPLSRYSNVLGVEGDKASIEALNQANEKAKRSIQTHVQDLFLTPIKTSEFEDVDVIVIDPPRAGASAQCTEISKSSVPTVIYISCNPHTFVQDTKILEKGGYVLDRAHLLDQFLFTPHMEVVGIFKK
jgi:23S rRNA (uracil1939-C5)-methyltransferase